MPIGTYSLNEEGKLPTLFEPLPDTESTDFTKWKCNEMCKINEEVIFDRLYAVIQQLLDSTPEEIITFVKRMDDCPRIEQWNKSITEDCEECNTSLLQKPKGHPHACYINYPNNYGCTSILLFLRCLAPHYPFIRGVVNSLYKIRRLHKEFSSVDTSIKELNVENLQIISDEVKGKAGADFVSSVDWPYAHEDSITDRFYSAFVALKKNTLNLPNTPCISCLKLFSSDNLTHTDLVLINNSDEWEQVLDHHDNTYKFVCNYCRDKFKKKQFPPTCFLNSLEVRTPPECLTRLNDHEKILIQRAKAFQVVTRMGKISGRKGPNNERVQKITGKTFHLPLPLEKTLAKLPTPQQALIPNQDLYVLVRAQPTNQKQVWQSFVNVKNIYEALQWLKVNNHLYTDIVLPSTPEALLDELDDIDVQFRMEDNPHVTDNEEAMLTQKNVDDVFYENVTIHSIGEERPNADPSTIYQMKNVVASPLDNRELELDIKCFPDLFCYGENGMRAPRGQPLTLAEYIKCRVMSVHSQFRLNIQYLFFLLSLININQMISGIYTTLNTVTHVKNMTVGILKEKLANKEFDTNASSIFNRLRNSSAFWNKPRNDINCMVRNYGPATWFLTFSPSEYDWEDLGKYLREINGDKAKKGMSISALVAMDPISTSRFIDNKFKAMLKFITMPNGPLGHVEHYAWRREYQSRGLQHFHLMLWVKDAPILGKSTDEEVSLFIRKFVTCHIPDSTNFPVLHLRVKKYQQHYHNSYCQRTKKNKQGKFLKVCRFGFSRPISSTFVMRNVATSIHGRRKLKLKSRLYDLHRTAEEIDINDYNPAIMMAWQGNMDIQFIGEKSSALSYYITKYTTKAEKSFSGEGFSDISASKPLFTKLFLMGQRLLSNRECGSLEAADTLLQISLFGTDIDTTIKWLDIRMERNRKLKNWKDIQTMTDDRQDIFPPSLIDNHYPNRPEELEDMCLFDFAKNYEIVNTKPQSGTWYPYGEKFLKLRKKPCLINHYNYNMQKNKEQYFYSLILLFKPFRTESSLLGTFKTYTEAFESYKDTLIDALQYHERLEELQRARDYLHEEIKELEKADEEDGDSQNIVRCDPIDDNAHDVQACMNLNDATPESVNVTIASLNIDQLRIFNNIREVLTERRNNVENSSILRRFISGVGGTGKSHLIKLIKAWVKVELNSEVIIAAPTGIAAFNVQGLTIHRLLKLPVEHGSTPSYKPLSDTNLKQLRSLLKNVLLIIIDEVSMVSNLTLLYIHLRLQEIYNSFTTEDGWFGGQNILVFGDLLQLSPVNSECPFVTLKAANISKYHNSLVADTNLWADLFSYDELTINVRQQSDMQYADILSRIRMGFVTRNDEEAIRGRQITFQPNSDNYTDRLKEVITSYQSLPANSLCLLATKKQCRELNDAMLTLLPGATVTINTKDKIEGRTNVQRQEAQSYLKKLSADSSNTGALEETLLLKVGCKVMLRRNIDAAQGLVNGAIGTVLEFTKDISETEVTKIKIRFRQQDYELERIEVKFEVYTNVYVIRSQFPITLAYGITIHKSQSLSLDSALLDIGNSVFCDGQTYVALSRLTSLDGVNIINFDPRNVKANPIAIEEYNRLRAIHRPDLEPLQIVSNKSHSPRDIVWWEQKITADPGPPIPAPLSRLPGFQNENNNCYANSSLQCLLSFKTINQSIMSSTTSPLRDLTTKYNDPHIAILNSDEIIESLNFVLGEENDSYEFIDRLSASYQHVSNNYKYNLNVETICTTDGCTYRNTRTTEEYAFRLCIPTAGSSRALNIKDILTYSSKTRSLPDYRCDLCHEYNAIEKFEIRDTKKILILTLNVIIQEVDSQNQLTFYRIPLQLNSLPTTVLDICGFKYQLKSAIFHFGEYGKMQNHYTAYIKQADGWYCANDGNISKTQWARGSKNVYILFYEKK